jgi:polysaccharide deacetylase family protein (PEP-CTERM system associated)
MTRPIGYPTQPHVLTVDIEDWYHSILEIEPGQWHRYEDRVVPATKELLVCLSRYRARATFFVLGHVAERHPELVPMIEAYGHEIACHGYAHRLVYNLTPDEFRHDLEHTLDILQDQTRQAIRGYRAPYWSITERSAWALDIIAEMGFVYDSSIYPTQTSLYGIPGAPCVPFRLKTPGGQNLFEIPPSVLKFPLRNIPFAGGIYLRLLPYSFIKMGMKRYACKGRKAVVYIHPPEFDPEKPRLAMPLAKQVLHYARLDALSKKLPRLLDDFRFGTISELLGNSLQCGVLPEWALQGGDGLTTCKSKRLVN